MKTRRANRQTGISGTLTRLVCAGALVVSGCADAGETAAGVDVPVAQAPVSNPAPMPPEMGGTPQPAPPVVPEAPSVDPAAPPVDPTVPPADPAVPPADPAVPPADPAVPPVDPAVPPVDPAVPPVDPAVPPVDPAVPPVDPAAPPVPVEPPTPPAPVEPPAPVLKERPNIVIVLADDMGWGDSGTYGHPLIQTPNMDRMAAEGVKLMQAYSASGVCSPSRSAILTGRTPYRNGVFRHLSGNHEAFLRASEVTYPSLAKQAGYATAHVGKWHLVSRPQFNTNNFPQPDDHGYDYWFATHNNAAPSHRNPNNFVRNGNDVGNTDDYSAQLVAKEAEQWLKNERDPDKPFVLSVWFHEPHLPIATNPQFQNLYGDHANAEYMGNITQLDNALGMVLDALDDVGETENTFVFFTSDNGPVTRVGGTSGGLRGLKRHEYEGGIRVPGLVRWPGVIEAGSESEVPVIGTDVFTTVVELLDLELPNDRTIDGVNMLPALMGEQVERPIPLFWRTHVSPPEQRVAMRIGDWKIVGDENLGNIELYNIPQDSQEENNLAQQMPERTEEMRATMVQLWNSISEEGPNQWWEGEEH